LRVLIDALPAESRLAVFSHSSYVTEREQSYERLEFLGDSVLSLSIAWHLYQRFPQRPEGDLARFRAHVVSRTGCAAAARGLGLGEMLVQQAAELGREASAAAPLLAESETVLAELVEAAIGACFLEYGLDAVAPAVVAAFADRVEYALEQHVDHKTVLQEELARRGRSVTYLLVEAIGPDHDRRFTTAALVDGQELGRGSGGSKKASEQEAAREALSVLAQTGT
jgi:ribonuclease III